MSYQVENLVSAINKKFGTDKHPAAYRGSEMPPLVCHHSGSLALDFALGKGGLPTNRVVEIVGKEGGGKALALSTPLATPTGWTTMGEVQVGDQVFDEQGVPTTVLGVYEVEPESSYDVKFNDGSVIRACGDHLWTTWTHNNRMAWAKRNQGQGFPFDWAGYSYTSPRTGQVSQKVETFSTEQIRESLVVGGKNNHSIPLAHSLRLPEAELPIDPWVLGYWIGNGAADSGRVTCSIYDEEAISSLIERGGYAIAEARHVKGEGVSFTIKGLRVQLRELGLLGNKHIPSAYLRSGFDQRLGLVRGLFDSDGHCDERGHVEFSQKSLSLTKQVFDLLVSLGERPTLTAKEAKIGEKSYGIHHRLYLNPISGLFELSRKSERQRGEVTTQGLRRHHRVIVDVVPVENEPMKCIMVDSISRLYLAGEAMIPTHNTSLSLLAAREWIEAFPDRSVIYFDLEHKLTPDWAAKLMGEDALSKMILVEPESIEQMTDIYREFVPTGEVSMVIVDSIGGAPTTRVMDPDRSAEKANMAGNSQGVTAFARFAANLSAKYNCLTLGINQMRDNMNPMSFQINTPGGHAWKHHCVARIQLSPGKEKFHDIVNGEKIQVGYEITARIFKNQISAPYRVAKWNFFNHESEKYGPVGIDTAEECLRLASLVGVIEKKAAWIYHPDLPDGGKINGDKKFRELLDSDRELRDSIVNEVQLALSHDPSAVAQAVPMLELDDEEAAKLGLVNSEDA